MLTRIILVGLIPGLIASPILPRQDASLASTKDNSPLEADSVTAPVPLVSDCGCNAMCEKEKGLDNILDCVENCVKACESGAAGKTDTLERRQPENGNYYAVKPMPAAQAEPSFSVGSSVHISIHTVSASTFPVVPMRNSEAGMYSVQTAYAVHTPQPQYAVHTPPANTHAVPAVTPRPSNPGYPVHQPGYGTGNPPHHPPGPASSVLVASSVHTSVHVHSSSYPVQPAYAVHTPPANTHAAPAVTPRPSTPGYPSHKPQYPVQKPPAYPAGPAPSMLVASSVHTSVHVQSPSTFPVSPMRSTQIAMYSAGPSHPVQPVYAVNTPPAQPHYGVHAPPADVHAAPSPAPSSVHAVSSVHPSAQPHYPAQPPPAYSSSAIHPVTYSSQKPPADPPHTTHMPSYSHAPTPDSYPGAPTPANNEACAQKCSVKCQTADIAFDVTQCRTSCISACAEGADSTIRIGSGHVPGDSVPFMPSHIKNSAGKPKGGELPAVIVGAETYEGCMKSCQSRFQHADIAFDVSQGERHCKSACAKYASSGVGIFVKRDDISARHKKPPPPPIPAVGIYATTYEGCMMDCHSKYQSADIAFDVSTGKSDCKAACARYASSGVGLFDKREVLEVRHKKPPPPPIPAVGVEATTYEGCMMDCHSKYQSADIAFDVSTGKSDCKAACARFASSGVGLFDKRDNLEVRHKKPAPIPVPAVGVAAETYEGCMSDCHSKYQSADIAFVVSQGESDCKKACARFAHSGVGIFDKREKLDVRHKKPTAPPVPAVGIDATTYEGCMSDCRSRYQSADIAFVVSQGESDCKVACARFAHSGVDILDKRDNLDVRHKKPPPPPVPAVGVGANTYEGCMSDCRSKYQSSDIAFVVSQGESDCKAACACYASSEVGIFDKREIPNGRHQPLLHRSPANGDAADYYEQCMSRCLVKTHSTFPWDEEDDVLKFCNKFCPKLETTHEVKVHKRQMLDTRPLPPRSLETGVAADPRGDCVQQCIRETVSFEETAPADYDDLKQFCESRCDKGASPEGDKVDKREILDVRHKPPPPPSPAIGVGATTYEGCMSDCHSKYQSADIAFEVSTGKMDCKAACARFAKSGLHIWDKKDEEALAVRHKKPPPPPAPGVGVGATTYEGCMSDCRSKFQHADIAFDVSTGQMDCKTACARFASTHVGIWDKRDEENLAVRHKPPPPPPSPAIGVGATTYEGCMSDCQAKFQSADIAFIVSQGKSDCKAACARYADSHVGIWDKREETTLAVRHKKPPPQPVPAIGVSATTYEACMSDCHAQYQSADIAFVTSQGKKDCKAACAKYASSGVGIFDKKDTVQTVHPDVIPSAPVIGVGAVV